MSAAGLAGGAVIFVNNSDLMGPDWRFIAPLAECEAGQIGAPDIAPQIAWEFHSGRPRSALERAVSRPNLARYRAAFSAVRSAQRAVAAGREAVLVSHLPRMAAATNTIRRALCPGTAQIAFAFNFTDLPTGAERAYFRRALKGVAEVVVFSAYERRLYADLLAIPEARIRHLPWAMEAPRPGPVNPLGRLASEPYLCAVGGEGRDYASLAEAMRALPETRLAIVARPHSVAGIDMPENVTVFENLPLEQTWRLAADSRGIAIPLRSDRTACGHITIVGAQLLGLPLVTTRSAGIADYVADGETALVVEPGDAEGLAAALSAILGDRQAAEARAAVARARAERENALGAWVGYFRDLAGRAGTLV